MSDHKSFSATAAATRRVFASAARVLGECSAGCPDDCQALAGEAAVTGQRSGLKSGAFIFVAIVGVLVRGVARVFAIGVFGVTATVKLDWITGFDGLVASSAFTGESGSHGFHCLTSLSSALPSAIDSRCSLTLWAAM